MKEMYLLCVQEMLKSLDEVVKNQHGRKVILYLLNPRDPHHFHPDIVKVLKEGDNNPYRYRITIQNQFITSV